VTIETIAGDSVPSVLSMPAGYSDEARWVEREALKGRRRLYTSYSLGTLTPGVMDELNSIAAQCQRPNWDAQGASPLTPESLDLARRFLMALPLGVFLPTLGAEPDGEVTAEWYRSPRYVLSISFGPKGDLHYASLLGLRKAYGSEPFFGMVPERILGIIGEMGFLSRAAAA